MSEASTLVTELVSGNCSAIQKPCTPAELQMDREKDPFLVETFDGEDDFWDPLNFKASKKWPILAVICFASLCVTCCSTMVVATYAGIERDFGCSPTIAILGLTLFVEGLGISPLLLGPCSEFVGRRPVYLISWFFFTAFNIQVAVAQNTATYLIGRFLGGFAGSAFLSVAGGSVTDLFRPQVVGTPMAVYSVTPFLGPVAGPLFSNFIVVGTKNWRWVWYFQLIWCGVVYVLLFFLAPETYKPKILKQKANFLRKKENESRYHSAMHDDKRSVARVVLLSCYRPFEIIFLNPIALFLDVWTSLLLAILYCFFGAFPIVFGRHGFSQGEVGMSFLGIGLGSLLAAGSQRKQSLIPNQQNSLLTGVSIIAYWNKRYKAVAKRLGRRPDPEEHLRKGILGGILVPVALYWFAFTSYPSVHWIVPIIASIPFGAGVIFVFGATFTYLVDAFRVYAASALAGNSFMRSTAAALLPLVTVQVSGTLDSADINKLTVRRN